MTLESHTTKPTPGPWNVFPYYYEDPTGDLWLLVGPGQFDTVAEVRQGHADIPGDVTMNAYLIAAAPELLDMLREARDQLWHLARDPNDNPLLREINAAIAKAEGRS